MLQKRSLTIGAGIIAVVMVIATFAVYRATIMELIQSVAVELRTQPYSSLLLTLLIIITSVPPMIGFTFASTLTGFIYGCPGGIFPAQVGAFVGAIVAYGLIKKYNFNRFIKLSPSKQEKYTAIQEAIEQGGFKMIMLIRLSPIPWPIQNMLLSILPTISTQQFVLASFLSSFKVSMEVWIGSQLADISNPNLPPSAHRVAMMVMGVSVFILVAVAWWLYRLTMQKVNEMAAVGRLGEKYNHRSGGGNELHDMVSVVTHGSSTPSSGNQSPSKKQE
ncbi:hypothetical protein V8B55DRAFT_1508241 [Mucor lusitanicus]|uniref:Golgi apparatus membrane protein TVP38 n=2 Tax=Mucor circinelloides f. lusitanicus TaxID=29924 RepID=A0A168PY22_MUCCL